ncbi:hypothetical protein M2135_000290 [Parabacteroides sp. PF5-9]|nr:hypothetical protein [Parabacteroides sp. PF5-9]
MYFSLNDHKLLTSLKSKTIELFVLFRLLIFFIFSVAKRAYTLRFYLNKKEERLPENQTVSLLKQIICDQINMIHLLLQQYLEVFFLL